MVIVEALKNIGGFTYFPDFSDYNDLNLRKHQAAFCPQLVSNHIVSAVAEEEVAVASATESAEPLLSEAQVVEE